MKRTMIYIDEEKCNGCGLCVPNCHEGALQIIDGKARLVSDLMCDGLGACIGHCPQGAIELEEREAVPYDEVAVISQMASKGRSTLKAHLIHMKDHKEFGFMKQGIKWLRENTVKVDFDVEALVTEINAHGNLAEVAQPAIKPMKVARGGGCPGTQSKSFASGIQMASESVHGQDVVARAGALQHWPVQMHLLNPNAAYLQQADLLLAADCTAFSMGNFHDYLKGKALAIACPKLDHGKEVYVEKFKSMIDDAKINTITVLMMEVPCCGGLVSLVQTAMKMAQRYVPVKVIVVSIQGDVISEDWMPPVQRQVV